MPRLGLLITLAAWLGAPTRAAAAAPQRIASCTIASDEMLVELLSQAKQLQRLVALSTLVDDSRYSNLQPAPAGVTGRCGGEIESLLRLKPDVAVVASFIRPELIARLKGAGVRVHRLGDFTTLDDVATNLDALGKLVELPEATATALTAYAAGRRQSTAPATPAPTRALQFFPDGAVSGADTLFDDMVRAAGGLNVGAERGLKGWPRVSAETLATLRPDVIFAAGADTDRERVLQSLRQLPGFKQMPAVAQGHLVMIPEREFAAASPHILKALAKIRAGLDAYRPKAKGTPTSGSKP